MKQASENATWSWSEIWSMVLKRQFNLGFWQRCEEIIQTKYETCDLGFWQRCGEWGSSSGESRSFCAKANSTCQAPKINQDCFITTKTNKNIAKEPNTRKMTNLEVLVRQRQNLRWRHIKKKINVCLPMPQLRFYHRECMYSHWM